MRSFTSGRIFPASATSSAGNASVDEVADTLCVGPLGDDHDADVSRRAGRESPVGVVAEVVAELVFERFPDRRAGGDVAGGTLPRDGPATRLDADVVGARTGQQDLLARSSGSAGRSDWS